MLSRASTKKSISRAPNMNKFLHPKRSGSRKAKSLNRNEIFTTSIGNHLNNHKKAGFFERMYEKYREYMVRREDKRYSRKAKANLEFEKKLAEFEKSLTEMVRLEK
jgi:hypothetical protein